MVAVAAKAVLSADTSKGAAVVAVISAVRLNALIVAVCASLGSPIIAANSNSVSSVTISGSVEHPLPSLSAVRVGPVNASAVVLPAT